MNYDQYCRNLIREFEGNHFEYYPDYVYKYYDFDGGYASLKNQTIQFTSPLLFDDQTECNLARIKFKNQGKRIKEAMLRPDIDQMLMEMYGYISDPKSLLKMSYRAIERFAKKIWEESVIKNVGVSCFTTLENSNFHWENYADNSRGICVKYNFKQLYNFLQRSDHFKFHGKQSLVHNPIIYVDEIMPVGYGVTLHEKLLMSLNWVFVKSMEYKNEFEYRIYSSQCNIDSGYFRIEIPKAVIQNIHFGKNLSHTEISSIKKLGF